MIALSQNRDEVLIVWSTSCETVYSEIERSEATVRVGHFTLR